MFLASACGVLRAAPALRIERGEGYLAVRRGDALVTRFVFDAKYDKPFLHPLTTPSGLTISRGYPVDPLPGETNDHVWHRGVFYGHGIVNGQDFWRELGREKTSRMVLQGVPRQGKKGKAVTFGATFALVTPKGESLGTLDQDYELGQDGRAYRLEAAIRIRGAVELKFGDTDDGGFAIRLSDHFRQERGAKLRNSEGQETTEKIWGKSARWVHYAAAVDGKAAGAVLYDTPSNVRYPTGWHARGYSLNSANPFATRSFTKDKSKDGSYVLPQGKTLTLRYRLLLHDGEMPAAEIEKRAPKP